MVILLDTNVFNVYILNSKPRINMYNRFWLTIQNNIPTKKFHKMIDVIRITGNFPADCKDLVEMLVMVRFPSLN